MIDVGNGHQLELAYGDEQHFGTEGAELYEYVFGPSIAPAEADLSSVDKQIQEGGLPVPHSYVHVDSGERPSIPEDPSSAPVDFEEEAAMILVGVVVEHYGDPPPGHAAVLGQELHRSYYRFIADPAEVKVASKKANRGKKQFGFPVYEVVSVDPLTVAGILRCEAEHCSDAGRIHMGEWVDISNVSDEAPSGDS